MPESKQALKQIDVYIYLVLSDLPVQVQSLHASNPPNIAVAVRSVIDIDIIYSRTDLWLESDAGVVGDVLHRLHHDRPLVSREGAIELVFHHT